MKFYEDLMVNASDVAIAIDNHRLGKASQEDYGKIKELSEVLYNQIESYDPDFENLMASVIWPNTEDWRGKTTENTNLQTWLLAKELETFKKASTERQSELVDACVNLSKSAMAHSRVKIFATIPL